jgi:drug/metabolite transporter (DMT)-like permease
MCQSQQPAPAAGPDTPPARLLAAMPVVFVLLWSTGFIGAKYGLPYAEPFTFLAIRALCTLALMLLLVRVMRASWPTRPRLWLHLGVSGLLVHGCYLGGVFYAIDLGMPAGLAALLVGLQPLLTAAVAHGLLGEAVSRRQWWGIGIGLLGIVLVLSDKLAPGPALFGGFGAAAIVAALVALCGISFGTLYQKRWCGGVDLLTGTTIQYLGMLVVLVPGALLFETREVVWAVPLVLSLAWLVMGLSIAAILLLMALIERGAASRVASLFYLVPPVTAVQAWVLFDERLGLLAVVGIVVTVLGVALAIRKPEG